MRNNDQGRDYLKPACDMALKEHLKHLEDIFKELPVERQLRIISNFDAGEIIRKYGARKNESPELNHFGEFVQVHRIKLGLGQGALAERLESLPNKGISSYTHRKMVYTRSWVTKLENGILHRSLPIDVKKDVYAALGVSEADYKAFLEEKRPRAEGHALNA